MCKHENVFARIWAKDGQWIILLGDSKYADARQCGDCGAWLHLGPSSDDSPEVAIKMRASELAARVESVRGLGQKRFLSDIGFDGAEIAGWVSHQYDSEKVPEQDGEWAGWLAREISSHATTEGE
jgi:hypothetical protein